MVIKFAILLALSTFSVNSISSEHNESSKEKPQCKCPMMMKAMKKSADEAVCKCGCPMMERMKKEMEEGGASKGQKE